MVKHCRHGNLGCANAHIVTRGQTTNSDQGPNHIQRPGAKPLLQEQVSNLQNMACLGENLLCIYTDTLHVT